MTTVEPQGYSFEDNGYADGGLLCSLDDLNVSADALKGECCCPNGRFRSGWVTILFGAVMMMMTTTGTGFCSGRVGSFCVYTLLLHCP
jgi:hypothetical protein